MNESITGDVIETIDVTEEELPDCEYTDIEPPVFQHHFKEGGTYKLVRVDE